MQQVMSWGAYSIFVFSVFHNSNTSMETSKNNLSIHIFTDGRVSGFQLKKPHLDESVPNTKAKSISGKKKKKKKSFR